jgi:hypothetical protein
VVLFVGGFFYAAEWVELLLLAVVVLGAVSLGARLVRRGGRGVTARLKRG